MPKILYRDFNSYLKDRFDAKVYKVTVDGGFTCPNRDGKVATGGCIYCNAHGSGNGQRRAPIEEQVLKGIEYVKARYRAEKIMVYFQAFTNTYAPVEKLREIYKQALCHPDIVAMAIGTRPDCIDREKLEMIKELTDGVEVWMEYGLESSHNHTLRLINRHHTFEQFLLAVAMTKEFGFKTCTHTIMGLPGESKADMLQTIERVAPIGLDAIKIHSLYIEKKTALQTFYEQYPFELLSMQEYAQIVAEALSILPQEMVIQRLTGDPLHGQLYAPSWAANKQLVLKCIQETMQQMGIQQGSRGRSSLIR